MGIIRFLLALSVLIVHSSPILGVELLPGPVAVRIFYIFSGFLMAMVITRKYQKLDRPYYYFITNRFLRLYPLYITVVIMTIILSIGYGVSLGSWGKLQYYYDYYHDSPQSLGALLLVFLSNITLIGQDIMTQLGINSETGRFFFHGLQSPPELQELLFIPIAWTVSIEFYFYLLSPPIVSKNLKIICGIILLVLAFRYILLLTDAAPSAFGIYRFAPTEIYWFLLGIVSYKIKLPEQLLTKSSGWIFFFIFILIMATYNILPIDRYYINTILYALTVIATPSLFLHFSKYKIDKKLGDLCYPIYLIHAFILLIVGANSFPKPYGTGLPTFVLTILLSVLLNMFLLIPIEKWRQHRAVNPKI